MNDGVSGLHFFSGLFLALQQGGFSVGYEQRQFNASVALASAHSKVREEMRMATDPICGMPVDPKTAAGKHEYNGQSYYFCSRHCLAKFKEDPEKVLAQQQHGQHRGHAHTHEHGSP